MIEFHDLEQEIERYYKHLPTRKQSIDKFQQGIDDLQTLLDNYKRNPSDLATKNFCYLIEHAILTLGAISGELSDSRELEKWLNWRELLEEHGKVSGLYLLDKLVVAIYKPNPEQPAVAGVFGTPDCHTKPSPQFFETIEEFHHWYLKLYGGSPGYWKRLCYRHPELEIQPAQKGEDS